MQLTGDQIAHMLELLFEVTTSMKSSAEAQGRLVEMMKKLVEKEKAPEPEVTPGAVTARILTHLSHCNFGQNAGSCKYGDPACPSLGEQWSWIGKNLQRLDKLEKVARKYYKSHNPAGRPPMGMPCPCVACRGMHKLFPELEKGKKGREG